LIILSHAETSYEFEVSFTKEIKTMDMKSFNISEVVNIRSSENSYRIYGRFIAIKRKLHIYDISLSNF